MAPHQSSVPLANSGRGVAGLTPVKARAGAAGHGRTRV